MNQFSPDILKTLIEIINDINSDLKNRDALLFRILKSAVRLVNCTTALYVSFDRSVGKIKWLASSDGKELIKHNEILDQNSLASRIIADNKPLICNEVRDSVLFSSIFSRYTEMKVTEFLAVPMMVSGVCVGVLEFLNKREVFPFDEIDMLTSKVLAGVAGSAFCACENYESQRNQIISLRQGNSGYSVNSQVFHDFISESPVIKDLMDIVKKAAVTNSSILLTGESGVGKELFAEQIFLNSKRSDMPFVRVNCAALSDTLIESELFGHVKGAYTSADSAQKGRFELADGGTIFLDEVGEIPLALQAKLLRVIQDKQFEKVGSPETFHVDVRIIAATNRNLAEMVSAGTFREDLFFRLNVLPIRIPSLRARKEDILPLAVNFLRKSSLEVGKEYSGFSREAIFAMEEYKWPGNIRELENAVARACIIGNPPFIQSADLRLSVDEYIGSEDIEGNISEMAGVIADDGTDRSLKTALDRFKRSYLIKVLEECNWNQTKASKILDIQRTYVSKLMNELNIRVNK